MDALKKPVIAVTMGDPAGIGPEVVLGALKSAALYERAVPVIIGNLEILRRVTQAAGITGLDLVKVEEPEEAQGIRGRADVIDIGVPGIEDVRPGAISRAGGAAADAFIRKASELALAGRVDAISTAPINKESLRAAGIEGIGHTEMFARYMNAPDPLTLFVTENMRIFFLSRHLSLKQAIDYINTERVHRFIGRVDRAMRNFRFQNPSIGVAALNPHASDGGQFGDEEAKYINPAVELAKRDGLNVTGPIGADSVFNQALEGRFDCVVSLYHDQGHIAAKTRDFHRTVTATLDLPALRTSVDHGTGFDIAWNGTASPVSMEAAILAACDFLAQTA